MSRLTSILWRGSDQYRARSAIHSVHSQARCDCVGSCHRRKIRLAMSPEHRNFYTRVLRPLIFRLDPETAHRLTIAALSLMPPKQPASDPPELATTVFGIRFTNPIG